MKYNFKQAVHIRPQGKPGKNFHFGINDVPEDYEYDPYFLRLVSANLIVDVDPSKMVEEKSSVERAKELLDRLISRKRGKEAPAMASRAEKAQAQAPVQSAPVEAHLEETKEEKKKKKG